MEFNAVIDFSFKILFKNKFSFFFYLIRKIYIIGFKSTKIRCTYQESILIVARFVTYTRFM